MSNPGQVKGLPISLAISLPHGLARQGGVQPGFTLSGSLPDGDQATDYLGALNISGGIPPYSNPQVIIGTLPGDFSLSISGSQMFVTASAPISASGLIDCTYQVDDSTSAHSLSDHAPFTITTVDFLLAEDGTPLLTEDGNFILAES